MAVEYVYMIVSSRGTFVEPVYKTRSQAKENAKHMGGRKAGYSTVQLVVAAEFPKDLPGKKAKSGISRHAEARRLMRALALANSGS